MNITYIASIKVGVPQMILGMNKVATGAD